MAARFGPVVARAMAAATVVVCGACLPNYTFIEEGSDEASPTSSVSASSGVTADASSATTGPGGSTGQGGDGGATTGSSASGGGSGGEGEGGAASEASSSTSSSGGGAGGGSLCPLGRATAGPYGQAELYFGEPEVDTLEALGFSEYHAMVSPDGLRLTRRGAIDHVNEYARTSLDGEWGQTVAISQTVFELFPHLTSDNLAIFSCYGSFLKCTYQVRDRVGQDFEIGHYFQNFPPFDGSAADFCFVPTPDLQYLAFCSDRESAAVDEPEHLRDLWVARAVDPDDMAAGHEDLIEMEAASSPGDHDDPTWFDDEGTTVAFHSTRGGTRDLFMTSRTDPEAAFGSAVALAELNGISTDESFFTLPSLAVLREQPCAQGYGYFQRESQTMRVPVCVGAPCE